VDRWLLKYREGGFDALVPSPRQSLPRTAGGVRARHRVEEGESGPPGRAGPPHPACPVGLAPDETTIQRMFHRHGLTALRAPVQPAAWTAGHWDSRRSSRALALAVEDRLGHGSPRRQYG